MDKNTRLKAEVQKLWQRLKLLRNENCKVANIVQISRTSTTLVTGLGIHTEPHKNMAKYANGQFCPVLLQVKNWKIIEDQKE